MWGGNVGVPWLGWHLASHTLTIVVLMFYLFFMRTDVDIYFSVLHAFRILFILQSVKPIIFTVTTKYGKVNLSTTTETNTILTY